MRRLLLILICLTTIQILSAQPNPAINPDLYRYMWSANWISCPDAPLSEYGVYHFRKTVDLRDKPANFIIHISADNRYKFYVNGKEVCKGPARSDLQNWHYETIDIAPYLKTGKNVLAALVWNQGEYKPFAQHSAMTAFLVQGNDIIAAHGGASGEGVVNTNKSWKVIKDTAFKPYSTDNGAKLHSFLVVGCGDAVDGSLYPWGWETVDFDDSKWLNARQVQRPLPVGCGSGADWHLTPRTIPFFKEKEQTFPTIRRVDGDKKVTISPELLRGVKPTTIPANTHIKVLIDQTYLTVGYPILKVSGGKGASIQLEYAEALVDVKGEKGNRNDIDNKTIKGYTDLFLPDGGKDRVTPRSGFGRFVISN